MDAETLDALLKDHALGETRGDLAALIDAYVDKDPQARQSLDQWQHLSHMARKALHVPDAPVALPPFPSQALQRGARRMRWTAALAPAAAMAACVCLGFLLGTHSPPPGPVLSAQRVQATVAPPCGPTNVAAVADFWSVSRVRKLAAPPPVDPSPVASLWISHARLQFFGGQR